MVKNKIFKQSGLSILLMLSIVGLTACRPEYNENYRTVSTEFFKVALHDKDSYAIVYELSDLGKEQEVLGIPSHVEGFPVKQIGMQLLWGRLGISSDYLKKLYIPYTIENTIQNYSIIANLDEVVLIPQHLEYDSAKTVIISQDCYDTLQNNVGAWETQKPANISYYFNYEDAPNSNIFWIDLIRGEDLYIHPEAPVRDGYTFIGWFTDEEVTMQWDGNWPSNTEETIDLFAGWNKNNLE